MHVMWYLFAFLIDAREQTAKAEPTRSFIHQSFHRSELHTILRTPAQLAEINLLISFTPPTELGRLRVNNTARVEFGL